MAKIKKPSDTVIRLLETLNRYDWAIDAGDRVYECVDQNLRDTMSGWKSLPLLLTAHNRHTVHAARFGKFMTKIVDVDVTYHDSHWDRDFVDNVRFWTVNELGKEMLKGD